MPAGCLHSGQSAPKPLPTELAMTTQSAIKKALSEARATIQRPLSAAILVLLIASVGVEQYLVHCRAEVSLQRDDLRTYRLIYGATSPASLCASRATLFVIILIASSIAGLAVRVVHWKRLPEQ